MNGISSNGICVFISKYGRRKRPALCVTVENDNQIYKVASFDSDEKAEWFCQIMEEFIHGWVKNDG